MGWPICLAALGREFLNGAAFLLLKPVESDGLRIGCVIPALCGVGAAFNKTNQTGFRWTTVECTEGQIKVCLFC